MANVGSFFKLVVLPGLVLLLLTNCQTKPTKVYETSELRVLQDRANPDEQLFINDKTIVVDTRSTFNYSLAHIKGSINLNVFDFYQKNLGYRGALKKDLFFLTRRLSRYGISPESQVVIVGEGIDSNGATDGLTASEFQLAWVFYYLGVRSVQYSSINYFNHGWSNLQNEKPRKNTKVWKPNFSESVLISKKELKSILSLKAENNSYKKIKILDVRSVSEFKTLELKDNIESNKEKFWKKFPVSNINWKNFLTAKGRPKRKVIKLLKKLEIKKDDRVIVVSNRGIRSAAVTMVLLDLGFNYVGNFSAGYEGY